MSQVCEVSKPSKALGAHVSMRLQAEAVAGRDRLIESSHLPTRLGLTKHKRKFGDQPKDVKHNRTQASKDQCKASFAEKAHMAPSATVTGRVRSQVRDFVGEVLHGVVGRD